MVIITGNKGFIGSHLHKLIPGAYGADIQDGRNILTCPLPQSHLIYHLAAQSSVEESIKDPMHDLDNIRMTARLVLQFPNSRIIFAQSAASLDIQSPYGFSKWASGEYLKKFHKNYVICTLPNIFGGGKGVVDIFKNQKDVTIYGDGEQVRDFVHIDDIIDGLLKAQNWPVGEYSMGSNRGTRIKDLAIGKSVFYAPQRQEIRESILPNTTPDWKPTKNVIEYLK